jgi:hypothetical protein
VINIDTGYYTVGNTVFTSKVAALLEGTKQNIHVEWNFNNEFFDHVDWTVEPSEDIYELYKQRAQQLREKYDYLVLMYSGGSDSQTILDVCLENNIRIDEIVVIWANSLANAHVPNASDYSWTNVLSEWDFNIKQRLQKLANDHPNIKITIHDWAESINTIKLADDFIADRNHNFTPYANTRWDLQTIPSIRDRIHRNENIGVVFGTDKPRICINNGAYRLYFLDVVTANGPSFSSAFYKHNVGFELFYWSKDSRKILAKQSHLLVKFFESMPQFKQYIQWPISNPAHRQFYETASRAIIYPKMDLRFFQVEKPKDMNFGMDTLLFKVGHEEKLRGLQRDNFSYLQKVIDKKYFNNIDGNITFTGFISGMWPLKNL